MKKPYLLERLKTRDGSVGILTLLMTVMLIIFLLIPISAYLFEKILLEILYCEISDTIELNAFRIINAMDIEGLSHKQLVLQDTFIEAINSELETIQQPQLKVLVVTDVSLVESVAVLTIQVELQPTLYRKIFFMSKKYLWYYSFSIPLDSS